jgi:hypothetical protein
LPRPKPAGRTPVGKYRAKPVTIDGLRFPSKKEGARYLVLRAMEKAGEIHCLELQPRYPLIVNGEKVGTYVADFRYFEGDTLRVEDVKGILTPVYRLKKKLVKALYQIDILET